MVLEHERNYGLGMDALVTVILRALSLQDPSCTHNIRHDSFQQYVMALRGSFAGACSPRNEDQPDPKWAAVAELKLNYPKRVMWWTLYPCSKS